MVAERARITIQMIQDTPSDFIGGDIGLSEDLVSEKLLPYQAAECLKKIWLDFEMSLRTVADIARRRKGLEDLGKLLSPAAKEYLEEEVEIVGLGSRQMISRGLLIKGDATREAIEILRAKRAAVVAAREATTARSAGERVHVRRQKASVRRGTNPKLIH